MADRNVMVLVDRDASSLEAVEDAVRRTGVKIEKVLPGMGTIVGSVSDELTIERVRALKGVKSIRDEGETSLPPMDPSIPQ
jgi:hypothetical protein